jgi:hypothetical protein
MSIGNTFENDLLKLIFNATAIANIADNAASSPLTNLSVALHTADPGEGGDQTTSEAAYTSYARVSVARTTGGWTAASSGSTSPVANIDFPAGTGGSGTVTHFSVGPTGAALPRYSSRGQSPRISSPATVNAATDYREHHQSRLGGEMPIVEAGGCVEQLA